MKIKEHGNSTIFVNMMIILPALLLLNSYRISKGDTECLPGQWGVDLSGLYANNHDCSLFSSPHFPVYGDGSSQEAKQQLAEIAEDVFAQLVQEFLINNIQTELQFTEGYTYYIYAEKYIENVAMGFRNGFYIGAIDSNSYPDLYIHHPIHYQYIVKHELTHVFQFTLTDCLSNAACPDWLGVWFREGQAIVMGGKGEEIRIRTLAGFQEWISDPDHVNPISINRSTDYPDQGGGYFPMSALAYIYLVDSKFGHGASISKMRYLFQLMKEGEPFEQAFENALNMSVIFFHDNFYSLMENYLVKKDLAYGKPN